MKVVAIGDIHGRTIWKEIVQKNMDADLIIFLGDYHDIYPEKKEKEHSLEKMKSISNFFEIINFKKEYPDKVILLLGNHDTHYMYDVDRCSRWDRENNELLQTIFLKNKNLFQYVYQIDNYLFVHGGVLQKWFDEWESQLLNLGLKEDLSNLADVLNAFGNDRKKGTQAINDIPRLRGGYAPYGGPTWADSNELVNYANRLQTLKGFKQIIGHNKVREIFTKVDKEDENTSITMIDVLHNDKLKLEEKYLTLENIEELQQKYKLELNF